MRSHQWTENLFFRKDGLEMEMCEDVKHTNMDDDLVQAALEAGMSEDEAERAVEDYNYNLSH